MTNNHSQPVILFLFGGESPEHEVSIASARNIYTALDRTHYTVLLCYIDREGTWWQADKIADYKDIGLANRVMILPGGSSVHIGTATQHVDLIFPVLHGQNGEDGTVQGLAKLLHTPILGCGLEGSVLCMDKILTKRLLDHAGIPIVPFVDCHKDDARPTYTLLAQQLGEVLFVKPAHLGSSIGVSKVHDQQTLTEALKLAFSHGSEVLIEAAVVKARELEVAVRGAVDGPEVSVVGEIVPDRDFYSYESKYDSASTSEARIPAVLDVAAAEQLQEYASKAFQILKCQGLARVDFFLSQEGQLYLNEVNTMPGFTDISMYPKLWEASGLPYNQLITSLITEALYRKNA